MGPIPFLRAAIAVAAAATLVAACDRQTNAEVKRSAETAGQKLDNAVDRTNQKLSEAGERMKPKLEEAGARISEAGDKVAANLDKAAANVKDAVQSDAVADTAITASIKTDFLKDPDLSVLKIDVDTRQGVVTLNGLADNEAARGRAGKIAESIKGVREVRNFLTVKRA